MKVDTPPNPTANLPPAVGGFAHVQGAGAEVDLELPPAPIPAAADAVIAAVVCDDYEAKLESLGEALLAFQKVLVRTAKTEPQIRKAMKCAYMAILAAMEESE